MMAQASVVQASHIKRGMVSHHSHPLGHCSGSESVEFEELRFRINPFASETRFRNAMSTKCPLLDPLT
jgi:hypothetical protein